ncbi:MAG: hypothetical protein EOP47_27195 [Sphingobacteriaceae bacterium]|nr:MAG: hypothetical protein EOP47_27195 [Sphingobacteriaceae bacterium]
MATVAKNVDEYIAGFPADIQSRLEQIRTTIKKAVPEAEEAIKYAIPTFVLHGNMVSFAAFKNHIGMYPVPAGDAAFEQEIAIYKTAKSTAQFPHGKTLPLTLITQFVKLRAKAMTAKK